MNLRVILCLLAGSGCVIQPFKFSPKASPTAANDLAQPRTAAEPPQRTPAPRTGAAPSPSWAAPSPVARKRLAVLDFAGRLAAEVRGLLTEQVRGAVVAPARRAGFAVMTR